MNRLGKIKSRLGDNLAPATRRMRQARAKRTAPDWNRWLLAIAGGVVLVVLSAALLDAPVMAWAAGLPPGVHDFFQFATRFGKSDWLLIPSAAVVFAAVFGDWSGVPRRVAAAWWEIAAFAAVLFVLVAVSGLTTDIVKPIVGRLRPDFVTDGVFEFSPLSFGGYSHYSFPSGHATTMGAVAMLAAFAPGVLTTPILFATAVVAVSRVMIGVHFPSDVVGGALIGAGTAYLMLRAMAGAGILFVVRPNGTTEWRFGALRRLVRRRDGLPALFGGLRSAWTGRP